MLEAILVGIIDAFLLRKTMQFCSGVDTALFTHLCRRWQDLFSARFDAWIPERSATRLREADLNVLSKLGKQGLEWRLEPEAFAGREVGREDDLLDFLVGCPVDIEVARQPST